jgi:hypothetical protein
VRLTDPQVQALERQYGVQIQDGSYWYDRVCGAWGLEGGPTLGFALPGLDLGGRLRADASNGNTGVFVNGRELHRLDVAALQQLGPVYQGRYWLDAEGYCGFEGEPAFCNLVQLARAAGGSSSGGQRTSALSTWDRTGVAVFDLR